MAERQDHEVEEADHIYLLMKEEYRISRNVRLAWFLGKLNQVIWPASKPELLNSDNELDLLSILPKGWQQDSPGATRPSMLMPSTRATFLARRYRFIIELDLSPSTGIVDDSTGEMIFDEVFHALSRCLAGLAQPFKVPGTHQLFKPKIFITILVYSSIFGLASHQVLVQGCQLDRTDLGEFLHYIYQQLKAVESNIADALNQQPESSESGQSAGLQSNNLDEQPQRRQGVSMVSADMGLVSMVRQGILALQLLPPNSSAGIIIITDGVMSVPDVVVCETLLNQLRSGTITCSFVQVGGAYSYDCSFGYIPNVELMKFISLATFGSYLPSCPQPGRDCQEMNAYHKAFLTYSFLKTPESMNSESFCVSQHKLFNEHLVSASGNPALVMRRKKHTEKEVHAHLISVVSVRLREGYTIREISLTKGGAQLEVKLVLLWKHNMHIEYLAAASWPLDPGKRTTRVEVTMEGSYDILHDISCTQRKPITSPYRTSVIRRFWNTLQSINQTDQMLVHLQSFNSIPENYTIPESTKNGVPLFYIPPGSTTPVLSLQHSGSKDSSQSQFASYWKPILSMDANFWQRWLHMHRIAIVLEHDLPVPKHLHTAGNNGRYSTIQCRISHSALTSLLRDWSSFVLVEGYSYVKLIYSSPEQPPTSFYLVRLISKTPCMVLRLGFPIGTPAHVRNKIVDELREQILKLRFPHRVQNKEATPKTKRKAAGHPSPSKSPSLSAPKQALSDRPCVVVVNKPLEKLLIRYEKLPLDFRIPFILSMENSVQPSSTAGPLYVAANRTASSTLASLSRYFLHRRWVWAVQSGQGPAVAMQAVAHILSMLSEIRLSEGFHFAASGDGIVNMVIELPMKVMSADCDRESHSCIVQYILFPPHATSTKDSFSTDDDNDTEVEAVDVDVELNLVTECWVEPQSGTVTNCSEQHRHLQGLRYQEVPQAIFPRDLACMSTMMTFEYLSQLCQNKDQAWALPAGLKDLRGEPPASEESIHTVPFQFDLIQLLPKCQQVELFFLTFGTEVELEEHLGSAPCLPNELLLSLFHSSLEQELSDREIPVADGDHAAFMHHILERERDGHSAPFALPVIKEEFVKLPDRQEVMSAFHTPGSSREMMGSTSTLQSFTNADLADEEPPLGGRDCSAPQWRCYAKHVSSQQILLTFLPATFTDVLMLMSSLLEVDPLSNVSTQDEDTLTPSNKSQADSLSGSTESSFGLAIKLRRSSSSGHFSARSPLLSPRSEGQPGPADSLVLDRESWDCRVLETQPGTPSSDLGEKVHFTEPQRSDLHSSFSRQLSQQSGSQLKCPVYVYNCCLELLKEQLVHPGANRLPRDVFFRPQEAQFWQMSQQMKFRSLSQDRSSPSPWTDLLAQPHKHKELAHHCSLLQEHYQQSFARGVYRSLQQSYSISSQDVLMAMDYCEESLQEMDITSFLQTLCGHIRVFRENGRSPPQHPKPTERSATFTIGEVEEEKPDVKSAVASMSSFEMEDASEVEPAPVTKTSRLPVFPLEMLQTHPTCDMCPGVHKIIQEKFVGIVSHYFKPVPSNPHYFFYCPPSSKREEDSEDGEMEARPSEDLLSEAEPATEDEMTSGGGVTTESDNDLVVEYEDHRGTRTHAGSESRSRSDSNTVNQDQDSFSILDGDSLLEAEGPMFDLPPLFLHITCSVNAKSCHGSTPICTLPTCLGEIISCLDDVEALESVDLNELSVTLDIFVLTLPLEIEVMSDFHHNRYTSESSVSLNRSPGQPSSYRSDEELTAVMDGLRGADMDLVCGEPLAKLPLPHKHAIEATMDEIRWLLEDEIVSSLRRSRTISLATLHKVAEHVVMSVGRPHCHGEDVPLQFVFRPEQSLDKFKEEFRRMPLSGYVLNSEQDSFYYVSLSRLHPQRIHADERLTESAAAPLKQAASNGVPPQEESALAAEGEDEEDPTAELGEKDGPSKADADNNGPAADKCQSNNVLLLNERCPEATSPTKTPSSVSLAESVQSVSHSCGKLRPCRVQSVVSSQGSLDSDMQGYDGGSSDSECESPTLDDQESRTHLMPDFWLIVKIHQDRVKVYSHSRSLSEEKEPSAKEMETREDQQELPEYLKLHHLVVRKIGELCRIVNQRMLLQDLHDSHVCNSLLVAESEEDIWKNESLYRQRRNASDDFHPEESYQARDYLAATMQFIPGHFACDVVWRTIIHIHPRLKMGPNMGVSRAIQALRSVLNSFCVGNRTNMFVYQERTTKAVFYLRLYETSLAGKYSDMDGGLQVNRSIGLARSQEPLFSEDLMGSRSSLEGSRPVGQVDKHILLLVHGVGNAGPEITDELVKVLRRRLDETTLDLITVMLVRNCKLTPADVEFIQPSGSPATEVMTFGLPHFCVPWLSAVAHYLRQNLLIFLHVPKYTDSNTAHHFKHCFHSGADAADGDIYLYNKPGGQGTGGKGIACITLTFVDASGRPLQVPALDSGTLPRSDHCSVPFHPDMFDQLTTVLKVDGSRSQEPHLLVRFDVWEQGNVSPSQLADKLQGALRHALCDAVMELRVLPNPLCLPCPAAKAHKEEVKGLSSPAEVKEVKDSPRQRSGSRVFKSSPSPITLTQSGAMTGPGTPESTTPTGKSTRRSFWDILSKPDSSELGSPKTTDDIVQERGEEGRVARRRHKTESVKRQWTQEGVSELDHPMRRQACQLEEGDAGALHPVYQLTSQPWIAFMAELGCPSIQQCTAQIASHFLLPSILAELVGLVGSLASDTSVKIFAKTSCPATGDIFVPSTLLQNLWQRPEASRSFILVGRNFHQWHCSTEQDDSSEEESAFTPHKGFQRFEASEQPGDSSTGSAAPRQRFLLISIQDKKVTLYSYNWSAELGASLSGELVRLVKWQNARAHVVHCLLSQKMGLFHHHCFSDAPLHHVDSKRDPNPFLGPAMEPDTLLRSPVPPRLSKEQGRLSGSGRSLAPLHFPSELLPFDEALRDVCTIRPLMEGDAVARHGGQLLEIKVAERRELEKQMKIENLFVTWQQRSAQSNMPIALADLETLKQSSRLVHYCATPLLFDPVFRKQIQEEQAVPPPAKKRHRSSDSTASGRDRSYSADSADMLPGRLKQEPWLLDISSTFLQQYVQYLQSMGFILVQVRPQSPARSIARARAAMLNSMSSEGRMSFSYVKQKSEDSPKTTVSATTAYHLQRALPGGIVLIELAFQGCYFCVKQYALECSRIPMGQSVNSQGSILAKPRCKPFPDATPVSDCALSMLFTEECDKVRDLMHVHSFSYDFHLRVVHQYLLGCHMTLRQGYQLTDFLNDFISQHPDIPKFGRNHVFQGCFSVPTGMITAHQLYNYITDHASAYGMKPLRMSKAAGAADAKKAAELHEYALVALWNSSGSYKDLEGLHHRDVFDVSLVVCHNAAPFEEQSDGERHVLRLRFYVIMTSQRELFPRLTADMRRFKKLPQIHREPGDAGGRLPTDRADACLGGEQDLWEDEAAAATSTPSDGNEFYPLVGVSAEPQGLLYPSPLFPLLNNEVAVARRQIQASVEEAMGHCRRDNLWRRLFHGEHLALDKLKLTKLTFSELEELLESVQSRSVGEIDPQLDCFLNMSPTWYQSLIKVLLSRFPQSCRHFDDSGVQYLAVLNQKFTDCFVLVFLDSQAGKTSLKVVLREALPPQPQDGSSPPALLVSMYHHLESVINTACYNLWTGLL
ncbi:KICSTOR complex protein SZT2-like isoform X3 [Entelurus aequoreus]|uniref:KICSTOR complex protein SZT2-like isoform X3 n=1 Tax=Entelurus aequoreus TaxID=161455 RepID=UPI002B1D5DE6|nr:KICSTOR complex protein SZT2-like isoform X3 [Entelurus aequoreus]